MIPFLGTDVTTNRKNGDQNGQEFIVASASEYQMQALDKATDAALKQDYRAALPLLLRIFQWVFGLCGLVGCILIIWFEALRNDPLTLLSAGTCCLIYIVLEIIKKKRLHNMISSDDDSAADAQMDTIIQSIYDELELPEDAVDVDVITFAYKIKDDIPVPARITPLLDSSPYMLQNMKAFVQDDQLFLVAVGEKYAFPLSQLRCIRTVHEAIALTGFLIQEPSEGDAPVSSDKYGDTHVKSYQILELEQDGTTWGIYFPTHERPTFESLTGLTAE